jgi:hypothetical protein
MRREGGGGIMIKGREDRTEPTTLRPDSLSDRFITPQDTCARSGYTRREFNDSKAPRLEKRH